ncbi:Caspase domain [Popillia japonica]|uniref:Caspase domain n=1 Tax=Popillia japonica TaxID=7064 RepID=A0AAW1L5J3_POPJA
MKRTEYTRHGLHCNTRGKEMVAKKLKVAVDGITNQRTVPIVRLRGPRDEDLTTSSAVEEKIFLCEKNPDILCLSEHWGDDMKVESLRIIGYKLISKYCRKSTIHGGTAIFAKNCLQIFNVNSIDSLNVEKEIEICSAFFTALNKKIGLLSVYRPPNGNLDIFLTNLSLALNKLYEKYDHIILVGDINIDALKTSINLDLMSDILDAYKMINLIDKPTRIFTNKFGDRSESAIDCVATNLPVSCLSCCSVQPNLGDHLAQILDVGLGITAEDVDCCPQSIEMRSIGFFSWRNTTRGSWFIQAVCDELAENGFTEDLLTLLTFVCKRVALDYESNTPDIPHMHAQKQIPCITSMLTRLPQKITTQALSTVRC